MSLCQTAMPAGRSVAGLLRRETWTAAAVAVVAAAVGLGAMTAAQSQSPQFPERRVQHGSQTEELEIPAPAADAVMRTNVARPTGPGPFPLAVINHGTVENQELRENYPPPNFPLMSARLLKHDYAVALPQRPGHGDTGGSYLESPRGCDNAQFADAGYAAAASIGTAVDYLLRLPYVKKQRVLLVGHSAGAWASLALASQAPQLVAAVINFAGGLGGHSFDKPNRNCAPEKLVGAAAAYGRNSRMPTLWLYAENDSYFGPALSQRLANAYRAAGGLADYRLLPPVENDGHYLIYSAAAERLWGPIVDRFVEGLR